MVTCRNCAPFIADCLDRLRDQTYKNIEIIVVEDASTDNSLQVVTEWRRKNKGRLQNRMMILRNPRRMGYAGAVNAGFYLARGEFIANHDGDDMSHVERIRKQVNYLRQNSDVGACGTNYAKFQHGAFHRQAVKSNWLRFRPESVRDSYQKGKHCVTVGSFMVRKRVWDKWGGPTRRIKGAEDYELVANFVSHGVSVANLGEVLYYYRLHDKQRSKKYYG